MHQEPLKESLPIEHARRANMEWRDGSQRRKAGRRPLSVAPRVIVGQLDFLVQLGSLTFAILKFALAAN